MSSLSPALSLPYLMPAQAQKHVTVNEALSRLDALVQLRLSGRDLTAPPALPLEGALYALGTGTTGTFAGHDHDIARFADGTWQFFAPFEGLLALEIDTAQLLVWHDNTWQTPELNQLPRLGLNTSADDTNRLAVSAPASLFTHAGSDHRMVMNKASSGQTASLMFQSNWSGRAELGLTGSDGFSLKLSADGSNWSDALYADPSTGHIGIGTYSPSVALDVAAALRCGQVPTASRPDASTTGAGTMIYDSDLNQPIWSDGTIWRDASGTAV